MTFMRRSTSEGMLDVVSEQTKHTEIPFPVLRRNIDLSICPGIRDARHQDPHLRYVTLNFDVSVMEGDYSFGHFI